MTTLHDNTCDAGDGDDGGGGEQNEHHQSR